MASELKRFLDTLEPVWEDPHEFDWLSRRRNIISTELKTRHAD